LFVIRVQKLIEIEYYIVKLVLVLDTFIFFEHAIKLPENNEKGKAIKQHNILNINVLLGKEDEKKVSLKPFTR